MLRASRRCLRPPRMKALPRHLPDWRVMGASPDRLATCLPVKVPISGHAMRMAAAVTAPTPGIEVRIWRLCAVALSCAMQVLISASVSRNWRKARVRRAWPV